MAGLRCDTDWVTFFNPAAAALTAEDRREADEAARNLTSSRRGAYGDNAFRRHVTGRLGELGALRWLSSRLPDVRPLFRSSDSQAAADIEVGAWQIEVKTWRGHNWDALGRSLAPQQLPRLRKKADVILFCSLSSEPDSSQVILQGWAPTALALQNGVPKWRSAAKADLVVPASDLRRPTDLLDLVVEQSPRRPQDPQFSVGECGHLGFESACWVCASHSSTPQWVKLVVGTPKEFHAGNWELSRNAHDGVSPLRGESEVRTVRLGEAILFGSGCRRCFPEQARPR